MTDASPLPALEALGDGPAYLDQRIWLPQLFAEQMRGGASKIVGKTFERCRFEGPAVLLALNGNSFSACSMGESGGDVRNLLLAPVGPRKVIGAIPVENCVFRSCTFHMVGFTGAEAFLKHFLQTVGSSQP